MIEEDLNEMQQQVREFHEKFEIPIAEKPCLLSEERQRLREDLINEELIEYEMAASKKDLVEIADALGDLLYVVFGAAIEHGLDMKVIVDEIHFSNLSKLGADGKPFYRDDGKILKGPNYRPPNLRSIIEMLKERE